MSNEYIIVIQSPNGEISIGDSRFHEKNIYIKNKLYNIENNSENNEHLLIYLEPDEISTAYSLEIQAFYIKLLCIIDTLMNCIRILTSNTIQYELIIRFVFSGYGYYSVSNFNKSGIMIYYIFQIYKLINNIFYYLIISYYYSYKVLNLNTYYSLLLLSGLVSSLLQLFITYYVGNFCNSLPNIVYNNEISSI